MTVRELVEELEKLDGSLRVFTHGYEGGYCDVREVEGPEKYCLNVTKAGFYGPHEKSDSDGHPGGRDCGHEKAMGVIL